MSKDKHPERIPQTFSFTDLSELSVEFRVHASRQRQVAVKYDHDEKCWKMTVYGLML